MPQKTTNPIFEIYEAYKQQCTERNLIPCEFEPWQVYAPLVDENHVPYTTSYGATWVRDLRKKTGRTDRPLLVSITNIHRQP